ncbi:MAG: HAMP domain-containing protein [Candidatus Dadabacteria bacterium]|nr:HAMP domain-containing protein [Candidatus Dadabacteria bacterium]MYA48119.1 HAMP domain-containing protein [Candidatus Dadabacteria bacterium]MYG83436.1 HAMP domain-containing protein [Candidatus Dadabacteria bacterium]MYK49631.1 HAMP domain-containing protein [Candidatus Dadabacteria bacterium]
MFSKLWNRISTQISTQLYISYAGAVVLIIIVSLMALSFLNQIGKVQQNVNEKNIPEMTSAFAIAQQTAMLVAAAPQLTASTPEQFRTVVGTVDLQADAFKTQLSTMMENQGESEQARQIQSDGVAIIQNIERIKLLVRERFELRESSLNLRDELRGIQSKITPIMINEIDDQMFYLMTGHRSLDAVQSPRSVHFSEPEFLIYRRLFELREAAVVASQLLATAFVVTDAAMLQPLRERFEAAAGSTSRSLDALEKYEQGGGDLHDQLSGIFEDLVSFGRRENNGFDLRSRELAVDDELSALLLENQALGIDIVARVESVVNDSSMAAGEMASKAAAVTATSTKVLLVFNIVAISGGILWGWILVHRRLIRRLERISNQMQEMADGNLEIAVDTRGNDEIAQLAKALEVFRYNALEVQRLNLVETLANQLQEKNEELAHTNEELKRAQDQIVMREKLAALGQLTAGVAHEIKNPMNFIMNFSEVSQELLEELLEEVAKMEANGDAKEEYDPELVEEVAEDLTGNLKRIHEHGTRANRIITDMLKMGRGGGEWQPTDLNILLNDHALLAFHSARAADPDFQLEIQEDYSPDIGEITVQPQDIGRVFLNLVTNACYAADEKRKMLAAADDASKKDYQPTLNLSTRLIDDHIEVHVRDNGTGIPESALERIFNPFYTTKPTDQGTGLGLSLSNDIVRQHGGEFRVETEEGEYTDMIVVLPLDPAAHQVIDTSEETAEGEDSATASS